MTRDNLPPLAPGWDPDPLTVEPDPTVPEPRQRAWGCAGWIVAAVLLAALTQGLGAVPLDLPLRDGPRLANEATAQLPLADLSTQRRSRHPETGSGLGEGEHLGDDPRVLALVIQNHVQLPLEVGTLGLGALLGGVREKLLKSCLDAGVGHLRCVHRFPSAVVDRQKVDDSVYFVNTPSAEPTGAIGTSIYTASMTWCAPTPTQCGGWGGDARLAAVHSFTFGDTPYWVRLWRGEDHADALVVSHCACQDSDGYIDVSPFVFRQLAPLSRGRVDVSVEVLDWPYEPGGDPPPHPSDDAMRAEDTATLPPTSTR